MKNPKLNQPFTIMTSYSGPVAYTTTCLTAEGFQRFRIVHGRRVWLSTPPINHPLYTQRRTQFPHHFLPCASQSQS